NIPGAPVLDNAHRAARRMGPRLARHHPQLCCALVLRDGARLSRGLVGREAIILCAVPSGFFGILFGLRYGVVSQDAGSSLIASTILSAATIPAAILLTAGTH